jgi:hypothetical protein
MEWCARVSIRRGKNIDWCGEIRKRDFEIRNQIGGIINGEYVGQNNG